MDWTTSLQALTDKARSSYKYLLVEWQELLNKVARGELAPSVLEDRLPQFLEDDGAEFYRRLSALSFELFNELSELQANSTNEFIRGLLGNSAVADSPAPSTPTLPAADAAPEEWTRWYQAVTAFIAEQNEVALRRYQILLEKVADGKLTPASVQEFSRKFVHERALVLSRDAGEMQMRFYEKLLQLNQEFITSLFAGLVRDANDSFNDSDQPIQIDCLESSSPAAENNGPAPSAASLRTSEPLDNAEVSVQTPVALEPSDFRPAAVSASLDLTGPLGGIASASLPLTNTTGARARVRCTVGTVRRADGVGKAFAPELTRGRRVLTLAPGETASLLLAVRLDQRAYEVGPGYVGVMRVTGLGNAALVKPFQIIAQAVTPARAKRKKKLAAKGRNKKATR